MASSIWKARWLVVDTETTGPDPRNASVVELGFVPFHEGKPGARYGRLLNPGIPIPADSTAIHGIQDADVADCPPLAQVAVGFLEHVRSADAIVGYNLLGFDGPLLEAQLGDAWRQAIADKYLIDPLVLVRMDGVGRYWKGPGRHKLTAVAERLGIKTRGQAHRATTDCILAGEVLWGLQQFPAVQALPVHPAAFAAALAQLRSAQDADFEAWRAKQAMHEQMQS